MTISRREFVRSSAAVPLSVLSSDAALAEGQPVPDRSTVLAAGEHVVLVNLTVKGDLLLLPGARIRIAAGRTLTILGDLGAPAAHIFVGEGKVDLTRSRLAVSRPEWWGAAAGDPAVDCAPAIEACLAAHSVVRFAAGDYHVARTVRFGVSFRRIEGIGRSRPEASGTTRIVLTGSGDVALAGSPDRRRTIVDFVQGLHISGLHFVRMTPVLTPGTRDSADQPAGLRIRYVLNSVFEDLVAQDQPIGFSIGGTVRSFVRDCQAFMRNSLPGAARAQFWGFHLDGNIDVGLAGGNASLTVADCNANTTYGEPSPRSIGAYLSGAFADVYLTGFECSVVGRGIKIEGVLRNGSDAVRRAGNADLHIVMPILDQCRQIALDVRDTAEHALIDVLNPYAALSPGGAAAINLERVRGQISITGGQMIGWTNQEAGGTGIGLCGVESEGFTTVGLKLLGFARPVFLGRCSDFDAGVSVSNPSGGAAVAVALEDCRTGIVRARVKGQPRSFRTGVQLSRGETLMVEAIAIDPRALADGVQARVTIDGRPATTSRPIPQVEITGLV